MLILEPEPGGQTVTSRCLLPARLARSRVKRKKAGLIQGFSGRISPGAPCQEGIVFLHENTFHFFDNFRLKSSKCSTICCKT